MRDVARNEDEVERAVPGDLVRDVDVAALRILNVRYFHGGQSPAAPAVCANVAGGHAAEAELCSARGSLRRGQRRKRAASRRLRNPLHQNHAGKEGARGGTRGSPTGSSPAQHGEGRNRTGDTTVFSRVLYRLSYLAGAARSLASATQVDAPRGGASTNVPAGAAVPRTTQTSHYSADDFRASTAVPGPASSSRSSRKPRSSSSRRSRSART